MGGYNSGRPRERQSAENSRALSVRLAAHALRELRRVRPAGGTGMARSNTSWSVAGEVVASLGYAVTDEAQGPRCTLHYRAGDTQVVDELDLVELPSNLGRGEVLYWRCPCGQLARVLYLGRGTRWRCRRCVPVVYSSSRSSDARVSAVLAEIYAEYGEEAKQYGLDLGTMGALSLRPHAAGNVDALLLTLKVLERLGYGIVRERRGPHGRWHGSMGRSRQGSPCGLTFSPFKRTPAAGDL